MEPEKTRPEIAIPKPEVKMNMPTQVELGKLEKAKPLTGSAPSIPHFITPPPLATLNPAIPSFPLPPSVNIPPPAGSFMGSPSTIVIALTSMAVVGFSVWFLFFHQPAGPDFGESPTPTSVVSVTATPIPAIETVFSKKEIITAPLSPDFFINFQDLAMAETLASGQIGLYKVLEPGTGARFKFTDFSTGTLIQSPADLIGATDDEIFYVLLMRKADNTVGYGFISKINSSSVANPALASWETTLSDNLSKLFGFDLTKAATPLFQSNTLSYPGISIRYRNFPFPGLTIDYAIINAPNGESFLVFANSREQIFAVIERIKTISPNPLSSPGDI